MKSLYITESEKQHILNLHKSKMLSEQVPAAGATTPPATVPAKVTNYTVQQLQQLLISKGYNVGAADNQLGKSTLAQIEAAVKAAKGGTPAATTPAATTPAATTPATTTPATTTPATTTTTISPSPSTNTFADVKRGNVVALSENLLKKINEQLDSDEDTSKHSVGFDKSEGSKEFWKEEFINKPKEEQERIKNEITNKVNEATELAKQNFIKYYSSPDVQNKLKSKFRLTDQNIKDLLTFIGGQKTIIFFSEEELKAKSSKSSLTAFGFAKRSTPNVTYINVFNFSGDATKETYYTTIYHEIGHTISYFFQGSTGKIKIDPHSGYAITQTTEMKKDTSAQYTSNPEEDYTRIQRLRDILKISPIINDTNTFGEKLKNSLKCAKKECSISVANNYLYIYNKNLNIKKTVKDLENDKNEIKKVADYILSNFFGLTINNTFNADINLMFANMANIIPSQEDSNKIIGFATYLPDLITMNNNFAAIENKTKNNKYDINSMGE